MFDKRTFVLPSGTTFEERTIVGPGDFILGNHVKCGFGLKAEGRVFAGQGAKIDGAVTCEGDLRLDKSVHVLGDVEAKANAYLGERCFLQGDLNLTGDLDVGDDVRITGQLKAQGWVNKRSPVPVVIYIFIYLLELLRMGQSEEVERILKELEETDGDEIAVDEVFLFIPDDSEVGIQESTIKGNMLVGDDCRILGNLTVRGDVNLGENCRIHGKLRADGTISMEPGVEIEGDLEAEGHVIVGEGCQILGDLRAGSVELYTGATVDGKILADGGVSFKTEAQARKEKISAEKVEDFEGKAADLVDLLG